MGILDILNRFGLFLDRSNFGVRVGNFRTNTISENSVLTQNARLQAIRFEKQFDVNRGNPKDFENLQRPIFQANVIAPISDEIQKSIAFRESIEAQLPKFKALQRSIVNFNLGRISFNALNERQKAEVRLREQSRQVVETTINPLNAFIQQLTDFRTSEQNRINDIFNIVAPNSSI